MIIIGLLLTCFSSKAQEKDSIVKYFDRFEYFSDSSIKAAYRMKDGRPNGYFIQYAADGKPILIGQYVNGKPSGIWKTATGSIINYADYKGVKLTPGCGTGINQAKSDFQQLYSMLLTGYRERFER